jgi:phytanoyl-CoA hydroxylase
LIQFDLEYSKITKRFVNHGGSLIFKELGQSEDFKSIELLPVDIPKGSLVIIDGAVVHSSDGNSSPFPRNAYTFHVIEGSSQYLKDNWLQIPGGFEKFHAV